MRDIEAGETVFVYPGESITRHECDELMERPVKDVGNFLYTINSKTGNV